MAGLLASAGGITSVAATGNACHADNCLRALGAARVPGRAEGARAFCAQYTATSYTTAPTFVPKYVVKNCGNSTGSVEAARISSACSCAAPATKTTTGSAHAPTTTATSRAHPCAQISAVWAQHKDPKSYATVPAALAYECFKTVPLGKEQGLELIDAIEPYLEWQSDAAYKKNPPKGYFHPGFDMFANLAKVRSNLEAGKYKGEYDFQLDLYKQIWAPGMDGHFVLFPDLLYRAFSFKRPKMPIVSISEDGTSLPVIKLQQEVLANPKTAQVITKINGVDASQFAENTVNSASYLQDVDAAYNTMFYSKATAWGGYSGNFVSGGRAAVFYSGPTTSLTFANGTTVQIENLAAVVGNMSGVVDGKSMYKKFCTPHPIDEDDEDEDEPAGNYTVAGYPKPVISTKDGAVSGYYLSGEGLNDVAVIAVTSFKPKSLVEFQAVTSDFLREAKAAGKTKLVVDLQNNGGGYILLGYDFFRQLFPKTQQDGNSRWKLNKAMAHMSKVVSDALEGVDPATESNGAAVSLYESSFNYRHDLNMTDDPFLTYDDKYAPHVFQNTDYTALMRWDLNDRIQTVNDTFGAGIEISGYGSRANLPQYFKAEDIIMLYDGGCSSTCTIASEFLRLHGGVKSVVFGGRPKEGPIQAVGGVKGSQVLQFKSIYSMTDMVRQVSSDPDVQTELGRYTARPIERSVYAAVNVRDAILPDHVNSGVPSQFVYQAADCRLYFTAPMVGDVTEVWKAGANAAFNGAKCAHGAISGSKPGRRAEAAPAPDAAALRLMPRLSELVDRSPPPKNPFWRAKHLQHAIN
ncbi:hypothetical protein E4U41_003011 [Claviceps citrina]|nr:hypothetical protein E4U41_003011 [Claviceps citrina]